MPQIFRSILIIQTKFIGDIVLASALAKNLRLEYPEARIVFLCEARFEYFLTAHGIASDVGTFRRARMRGTPFERGHELYTMLRTLRRFGFDLSIDLTDSKTLADHHPVRQCQDPGRLRPSRKAFALARGAARQRPGQAVWFWRAALPLPLSFAARGARHRSARISPVHSTAAVGNSESADAAG
ncbi:hypothetical protein MESS4_430091 [Mesorhizobium sp. STM 4661]|nr:hypothetical protein MESS4_430091 [Mesorhizobium sp. STM 4661]